jgi:hypothetical protein
LDCTFEHVRQGLVSREGTQQDVRVTAQPVLIIDNTYRVYVGQVKKVYAQYRRVYFVVVTDFWASGSQSLT